MPKPTQRHRKETLVATKRIGFTGTRQGMTLRQQEELKALLPGGCHFHHGDCIGADAQAHKIAREKNCYIVAHPSNRSRQRAYCVCNEHLLPKPPLTRNRAIVEAVDGLIGAPATSHEVLRSGTWATIRYARKVGKPIHILEP